MAAMADVGLEVDLDSVGDDVLVEIDPTQMRRVVHNLIINGVQATSVAGQGKVSVRGAVADGSFDCIVVVDTGVGIPADKLAMIFEPYYSTKENGTGLGLAISKRIVEEHSGTLVAESKSGEGSTFQVRLPVKVKTGWRLRRKWPEVQPFRRSTTRRSFPVRSWTKSWSRRTHSTRGACMMPLMAASSKSVRRARNTRRISAPPASSVFASAFPTSRNVRASRRFSRVTRS